MVSYRIPYQTMTRWVLVSIVSGALQLHARASSGLPECSRFHVVLVACRSAALHRSRKHPHLPSLSIRGPLPILSKFLVAKKVRKSWIAWVSITLEEQHDQQ